MLVYITKNDVPVCCSTNIGTIAAALEIRVEVARSVLSLAKAKGGEWNGFLIEYLHDVRTVAHCGKLGVRVDTKDRNAILCDKCCFKDSPIDCLNGVDCELGSYYYEPRLLVKEDMLLRKLRKLPKKQYFAYKTLFGWTSNNLFYYDTEKEAIDAQKARHKKETLLYIDELRETYFYRSIVIAKNTNHELAQVMARRIIERLL